MNVGNNLLVESLQDNSKSRELGFNIGYGSNKIENKNGEQETKNNGSVGFNYGKADKNWVSDQTEITGGNSVNINVANNTHIKGAKIANEKREAIKNDNIKGFSVASATGATIKKTDGGNLTLTTNTLTHENIYDKDNARSIGIGVSGENTKDETGKKIEGKGTKGGSVDYSMHDKRQTNNATIGLGEIIVGGVSSNDDSSVTGGINRDINKSQVITKDLSVEPIHVEYTKYEKKTKLDENGNEVEMSYGESLKDGVKDWVRVNDWASESIKEIDDSVGQYLDKGLEKLEDVPVLGDAAKYALAPVYGASDYFFTSKNHLYNTKGEEITDPTTGEVYFGNGMGNTLEQALDTAQSKSDDFVLRYNDHDGLLGDFFEATLDSTLGVILPGTAKSSHLMSNDIIARGNMKDVKNTVHSQSTIKMRNAANHLHSTHPDFKANPTQSFNAIGSAVTKKSWDKAINKITKSDDKINYKKNPNDSVGDLTNFAHPWRIPIGIINIKKGGLGKEHSATNPNYSPYLESNNNIRKK